MITANATAVELQRKVREHIARDKTPELADVRAGINGLFQQLEYPSAYHADQFASSLRRIGALLR